MMLAVARTTVRRGLRVEADEIARVVEAANRPYAAVVPADFFDPYVASGMDVGARMATATVLVVAPDSDIVGTVTLFEDINDEGMPVRFPSGTAGLRVTAVHPAAQGHGIGQALVEACIERARSRGAGTLALHTAPFMRSAIALYERCGFRRDPRFDYPATAFFGGTPRDDLVAMAFVRDL